MSAAPYHSAPDPPDRSMWQKILNKDWPTNARLSGPLPRPIDVWIWVEWEHDGHEVIPGQARRWTGEHVLVVTSDARNGQTGIVWLHAKDVRRR